ncbi:C2 calcium-dependent domain-containing protein 4C-like, partial [Sceloporus undulatus]|uniref:C2 calcium-dependent domain-containing protein 4C-like n=1 Tax=Sceloporus undulatus TaxID=8520 RepID=UPI001C4AC6F1
MWLLDKVRSSPGDASPQGLSFLSLPSDKSTPPASAFSNILTPDRIPEFCIPPRLATPPPMKSPGAAFLPHRCLTEPCLQHAALAPDHISGMNNNASLFLPHLIQVESVEEISGLEEEEEEEGGTNSDPQSQAALSLPHFPKAQTSYGFCTLLESPHTRRKESIFHSEGPLHCNSSGSGLSLPRSRASSYSGRELASTSPMGIHPVLLTRRRQGAWDSDTASSTESSPFSSPRLGRSPFSVRSGSLFKAWSHDGLLGKTLKTRSSWARSGRADSLSTEE